MPWQYFYRSRSAVLELSTKAAHVLFHLLRRHRHLIYTLMGDHVISTHKHFVTDE